MSFSSARALWARADERRRWIGDDHGDPYETALLCQNVPLEMQIALKELLEHLRSALDYAARAICAGCGALTGREKIYFPIARPSAREADFAALVGRTMPGILEHRPELVDILASFQAFRAAENMWLPDLATLVNVAKHEFLEVNEAAEVPHELHLLGPNIYSAKVHAGDIRMSGRGLTVLRADQSRSDGVGKMGFICLQPIRRELLDFLRAALPGTQQILDALEATCVPPVRSG